MVNTMGACETSAGDHSATSRSGREGCSAATRAVGDASSVEGISGDTGAGAPGGGALVDAAAGAGRGGATAAAALAGATPTSGEAALVARAPVDLVARPSLFAGDFAALRGFRALVRAVPDSSAAGFGSPRVSAGPVSPMLCVAEVSASAEALASAAAAIGRFGARLVRVGGLARTAVDDRAAPRALAAGTALALDSEPVPDAPALSADAPSPDAFSSGAFSPDTALRDPPVRAALEAFVPDPSASRSDLVVVPRGGAAVRGTRRALAVPGVLTPAGRASTGSSPPDVLPALPEREPRVAVPAVPPPDPVVRRAVAPAARVFAVGREADFVADVATVEAASSGRSALSLAAASAAAEAALFSGGVDGEGGVEVTPLRYQAGLLFGGTHRRLRENSD